MVIEPNMDESKLIPLMGKSYSAEGCKTATLAEAVELKSLLLREFPGYDTEEVPDARWDILCQAAEAFAQK